MYVDLHVLEEYVNHGVADVGVALVMNDLRSLVMPKRKNGKAWAYDISDGFTYLGGRIAVPVGGKAVSVVLTRHYPFRWNQFGSLWFAEIEGVAPVTDGAPSAETSHAEAPQPDRIPSCDPMN